jgi:hypothetical protein
MTKPEARIVEMRSQIVRPDSYFYEIFIREVSRLDKCFAGGENSLCRLLKDEG